MYRCNQKLPKPFPALARQVCKQWCHVINETSNLWSMAVTFTVADEEAERHIYRDEYDQFVKHLKSSRSDLIVYLGWAVGETDNRCMTAKILNEQDQNSRTFLVQNFILFLKSTEATWLRRSRVGSLFLGSGSLLAHKAITQFLTEPTIWTRLRMVAIRAGRAGPGLPDSLSFEDEELLAII
jgi:hypothetical protein